MEHFMRLTQENFQVTLFDELKTLPHFDPERTTENPPKEIQSFRNAIEAADGLIICSPEYVFSIPSGLKNAIEWCVSATVFSDKPIGIITASSAGEKGHKELKLIMKTLMANFTEETTLLISGIKGKINQGGELTEKIAAENFLKFVAAYVKHVVTPN